MCGVARVVCLRTTRSAAARNRRLTTGWVRNVCTGQSTVLLIAMSNTGVASNTHTHIRSSLRLMPKSQIVEKNDLGCNIISDGFSLDMGETRHLCELKL